MTTAIDRLVEHVSEWPGVETASHRFGGTEFLVADKEIGHVHDVGILDLAITKGVRDTLLETGLASPHHVLPDSAWVSFSVTSAEDEADARRLLRLAYLWRALALRRRDIDIDPTLDPDSELTELELPSGLDALVRTTFSDSLDRPTSA
ncbi:luciferase family protein [Haloferax sp. YSMS24]|uniref:luciferase domain-containing protein n=1 Tax=unclassified Haloferax TaxID=2625095 RepID=UPI00398D30CF